MLVCPHAQHGTISVCSFNVMFKIISWLLVTTMRLCEYLRIDFECVRHTYGECYAPRDCTTTAPLYFWPVLMTSYRYTRQLTFRSFYYGLMLFFCILRMGDKEVKDPRELATVRWCQTQYVNKPRFSSRLSLHCILFISFDFELCAVILQFHFAMKFVLMDKR